MIGEGLDPGGVIRVLALVDALSVGGAELLLAEFARVAPGAGIELSVSSLHATNGMPGAARLRKLGIEPAEIDIPPRLLSPASLRLVSDHVAAVAPDVLHTHLDDSDTLGGLAARRVGVPTVATLHAMDWSGPARRRVKARLAATVRRRAADRVIAVSESARESYLDKGWDRPEHLVVVHNGVSDAAEPGAGRAVRAELGLAPDDFVVGMVSALRPEKGHDVALAALEILRREVPNARLVVAGDDGGYTSELRRAAEASGDELVLTGHRDDVMALLDCMDVCLHPSRADAFPTTLLEALAARVPIVSSRVGGIPEIVDDGRSGLLVDAPPRPEDVAAALARLHGDPALRRQLAEGGRARFEERFEARRWAQGTREVYEDVLAGS